MLHFTFLDRKIPQDLVSLLYERNALALGHITYKAGMLLLLVLFFFFINFFTAWLQRNRPYICQTEQNFGLVEQIHEQE